MNLRFDDEDPQNFALRLQNAHQHRLIHEAQVARDIRLDMMDLSDVADPPDDYVENTMLKMGKKVVDKIVKVGELVT